MLFSACSILLFYFSPLCVTGYREFPLNDKALGEGSEGHVSLGCRSEERIQTASRGPSLITSDPDKIPRHALGPRDAAIRFSSLREEFVKDGPS